MKIQFPYLFVAGFLITLSACNPQTEPAHLSGIPREDLVDAKVQAYIDSGKIAGLAIGVARNDSILFLKSYGYADLEFDVPMPVNASFEIGSVTKQFTATAILQLVDKGMLSLDDDLTKYLDFDTHGRTVTIHQLLNHTSGIKGYTEMPMFERFMVQDYPRDTLLRIVEKEDFDFEPGTAMIYNNTAFFMLGLIIEKVSGKSYAEYLKENIFDKAGMPNTYYCDEKAIRKLQAHGYDTGPDGKLHHAGFIVQTWPYAAGSLCSTVEDLLRWNWVLHNTELVLPKERYEQMMALSHLADGTELRYSMGLAIADYKGVPCILHGGGINGFLSDSRYFPNQKLAIVTLINSLGPVGPSLISNLVADQLLPIQNMKPAKFDGDITSLAGTYLGTARGRELKLSIEAADSLLIAVLGERKDTLRYSGQDYWFLGSQHYFFKKNGELVSQLGVDQTYGYYILRKKME